MSVSAGSFTVGSTMMTVGDYADWNSAFADIAATLTGHLTFVQISNITITTTAKILVTAVNCAGFNLTLTSNVLPLGNPLGGWATFSSVSSGFAMELYVGNGSTGNCIVQHLRFKRLTGQPLLLMATSFASAAGIGQVHDCVFDGNDFNGGVLLDTSYSVTGVRQWYICYNNVLCNAGSGNDLWDAEPSHANSIYEANTALVDVGPNTYGFVIIGDPAVSNGVWRNNAGLVHTTAASPCDGFRVLSGTTTGWTNNGSTGTAPGAAGFNGVSAYNELLNVRPYSPFFPRLVYGFGDVLWNGGAVQLTSPFGVRNNARPGPDAVYSIGADEAEVAPAPTVTSVSPPTGVIAGGQTVVVNGTNFIEDALFIRFDGVAATSLVWLSETQYQCVTPAHAAGLVNVTVENFDAQVGTGIGVFTYFNPAPVVTSVVPSTGPTSTPGSYPAAGPTTINVNGNNFLPTHNVYFGGVLAPNKVFVSVNLIQCKAPFHGAGLALVTVS